MNRLVVLGGGESGIGAALLAQHHGWQVFLSDNALIADKYKTALESYVIEFEEKGHTESLILNADIIVKSPGIPPTISLLQRAYEKGITIISEIEFASRYSKGQSVAITGTNGKTTTSTLTHHILSYEGEDVALVGNIGKSYAEMVATSDKPLYVIEVSSFQLDDIDSFSPRISVITNIQKDHLERYQNNFDKYVASKFRITEFQTSNDYLIYDADDHVITNYLKNNNVKPNKVPFSAEKEVGYGLFCDEINITVNMKQSYTIPVSSVNLQGEHNYKNAMASIAVAELLRIRKDTIRESLKTFQGVEHRLEKVCRLHGVDYINDSKATNINAVFYALRSIHRPVVWIAGGIDKGNDYMEIMSLVREKVKAIICLGLDSSKIVEAYKSFVPYVIETYSMDKAVNAAYNVAENGDAVLLSPACASFDLFESYEDRGRQFKNCIEKLK